MSRTGRGSKSPGYEYWSSRPGNKRGGLVGPEAKKRTHGVERRDGKRTTLDEASEPAEPLTKIIRMPPQECPVCGRPYNGMVTRYACDPPIDEYPCGCRVKYVRTGEVIWREADGRG